MTYNEKTNGFTTDRLKYSEKTNGFTTDRLKYSGSVSVSRNHEFIYFEEGVDNVHRVDNSVYLKSITALGATISPDEARKVAAALIEVADEVDAWLEARKPSGHDILRGLKIGRRFKHHGLNTYIKTGEDVFYRLVGNGSIATIKGAYVTKDFTNVASGIEVLED